MGRLCTAEPTEEQSIGLRPEATPLRGSLGSAQPRKGYADRAASTIDLSRTEHGLSSRVGCQPSSGASRPMSGAKHHDYGSRIVAEHELWRAEYVDHDRGNGDRPGPAMLSSFRTPRCQLFSAGGEKDCMTPNVQPVPRESVETILRLFGAAAGQRPCTNLVLRQANAIATVRAIAQPTAAAQKALTWPNAMAGQWGEVLAFTREPRRQRCMCP